jgi:hypothetical protein
MKRVFLILFSFCPHRRKIASCIALTSPSFQVFLVKENQMVSHTGAPSHHQGSAPTMQPSGLLPPRPSPAAAAEREATGALSSVVLWFLHGATLGANTGAVDCYPHENNWHVTLLLDKGHFIKKRAIHVINSESVWTPRVVEVWWQITRSPKFGKKSLAMSSNSVDTSINRLWFSNCWRDDHERSKAVHQ